ncbi:MAG: type II toxin-antitoxin system VapC family toxin [Candidatus Deferrimicrobium sp.]|nr:type II toxin-antitoxin system VapC family toxin [Candidatus Deferrimicrobium sp.]
MKFWDASAVIPLLLREPNTLAIKKLLARDPGLVAWWGTPVECYSAFARLRRDGILTLGEERSLRGLVGRLSSDWTEVLPGNGVREHAGRLMLRHPLRAADSLQLAAAIVWADGNPGEREFVCLDRRLREAASREGFRVIPETLG